MSPTYKLTYHNVRALAEPIRFIFAYTNTPYEDNRIDREKWSEEKSNSPWGQLPLLEVDGKVLGQSLAITRYLGKIFNLAGENEFESAKCDEMVECMADLGKASRDTFTELDEEKKKELTVKLVNETFPKYFKKWNEILENNNEYGFLVGKKLSYADFVIASFLQLYNENLGGGNNLFENYSAIQTHQEKIFNTPGIKEWVEKRPKTQW